jgi:hypothetical protein
MLSRIMLGILVAIPAFDVFAAVGSLVALQ